MENLKYIKEVLGRLEKQVAVIENAKNSMEISDAERELVPIMKDLQLAIPRLGIDVAALSRKRRAEMR